MPIARRRRKFFTIPDSKWCQKQCFLESFEYNFPKIFRPAAGFGAFLGLYPPLVTDRGKQGGYNLRNSVDIQPYKISCSYWHAKFESVRKHSETRGSSGENSNIIYKKTDTKILNRRGEKWFCILMIFSTFLIQKQWGGIVPNLWAVFHGFWQELSRII